MSRPNTPSQSSFWSPPIRRQWEKSAAPCNTTKGFTSSEGCSCTGPSTSQRLAPFTVVPNTSVVATSRQPTSTPSGARCSQRRRLVRTASTSNPQLATIHTS